MKLMNLVIVLAATLLFSCVQENEPTISTDFSKSDFISMAKSDSRYVVVGSDGSILTSTTGTEWEGYVYSQYKGLLSIIWSGDKFVAVGEKCLALTSPDGLKWTRENLTCPGTLYSIAFFGGRYVAVGAHGGSLDRMISYTSLDGQNWQFNFPGAHGYLLSVAGNAGKYVAVGHGASFGATKFSSILESADGVTWSQDTAGIGVGLHTIIWSGKKFYASGENGVVMISDSGKTWETYNVGDSTRLTSSVWRDSSLIALSYEKIFFSTTDSNWVSVTPGFSTLLLSIQYYNGMYFLIGRGGFIRYSSNGLNWTPAIINQ